MLRRAAVATLTALALSTAVTGVEAQAADQAQHLTGTLANGAPWVADVPAKWNGTVVLYSHGYYPFQLAQNGPDILTSLALRDRGYAMVGSGFSKGGWSLETAAEDQLGALAALSAKIGEPKRTIALGTSMGGLIAGQLAEKRGRGQVDGVVTTCGLVMGGVDLMNYQLDGAHAVAQLLAEDQKVRLTNYTSDADVQQTVQTLSAAVEQGQKTPAGRARVALAAALHHLPTWTSGAEPPTDVATQQAQQHAMFAGTLGFVIPSRLDIEKAVGGNASSNVGVDYAKLFAQSEQKKLVTELYRQAGLDLAAALAKLTRTADVAAEPAALAKLKETSTLTGQLQVPVLSLHTISDTLSPVQAQEEYAEDVREAGKNDLFRQAFVKSAGHCVFSSPELLAAVSAMDQRLTTGSWAAATPAKLDADASKLWLLGEARFEPAYRPAEFLSDRG